jgi:putative membrane protein
MWSGDWCPAILGEAGFHEHTMAMGLLWSVVFGLIGIVLTMLGFKVFDWITPKIDVEVELAQKQNIAVAIVCAAVIIGISIVIAAAISG